MKREELIKALRRLKVQTGSLACMGCGHEHGCSVHGCAIIAEAIAQLQLNAQTVDAVHIVRCKECMWWKYNGADDALIPTTCYGDDGEHFCSYGERRDGTT